MTKTWHRQAVGLAAGACLLTGFSAAQAAPTSGLIDLGPITITNGQSVSVDFNGDELDDFTFSIDTNGIVSFQGHSVNGFFGNNFGQGHNTLATNGSGGAIGVGRGNTVRGTESIFGEGGEGVDAAYLDFEIIPDGDSEGEQVAGEQEGTIGPLGPDEFLVGQIYGIDGEIVTEPMTAVDFDIDVGPNGTTLTLTSSLFQDGDTIRIAALPEPGAAALLLGGLIGLGAYRRRRQS